MTAPPRRIVELVEGRPEPGRLWIRFWPRIWPGPGGRWVHLGSGGLGQASPGAEIDAGLPDAVDDVVYLPPVPPSRGEQVAARDRLVVTALERGIPVLVQLLPGDPRPQAAGVVLVYDLLEALLAEDLARLDEVEEGAAAVWPLLAGLTVGEELWEEGCRRLARGGVRCVQALALDLLPQERRSLVESQPRSDDGLFEALFHGPAPAEEGFARVAGRYGLSPFLPRPLPGCSPRLARNRRASSILALMGELWLRLGRSPGTGQDFYRAARFLDRADYDLVALSREGNLHVLSWLDDASRRYLDEWAKTGTITLYDELLAEYLGGAR